MAFAYGQFFFFGFLYIHQGGKIQAHMTHQFFFFSFVCEYRLPKIGGIVQVLAGMWEFACGRLQNKTHISLRSVKQGSEIEFCNAGNTFGATAFSSYGM
jgi:hypothetical protein